MTKIQFLLELDKKLFGLATDEIEERLLFYSEMIEDRMEEGLTEEEAVAAVGDIDEIAASIMAEFSTIKPEAEIRQRSAEKPRKRLGGWEIALLILGIPVWLPLISAALVIGVSLYASAWATIISLWALFVSIGLSALYFLALGITHAFGTQTVTGIALIGASLVCAGLTAFAFYGCLSVSKLMVKLTLWIVKLIKRAFSKKEVA